MPEALSHLSFRHSAVFVAVFSGILRPALSASDIPRIRSSRFSSSTLESLRHPRSVHQTHPTEALPRTHSASARSHRQWPRGTCPASNAAYARSRQSRDVRGRRECRDELSDPFSLDLSGVSRVCHRLSRNPPADRGRLSSAPVQVVRGGSEQFAHHSPASALSGCALPPWLPVLSAIPSSSACYGSLLPHRLLRAAVLCGEPAQSGDRGRLRLILADPQ